MFLVSLQICLIRASFTDRDPELRVLSQVFTTKGTHSSHMLMGLVRSSVPLSPFYGFPQLRRQELAMAKLASLLQFQFNLVLLNEVIWVFLISL